MDGFVRVVDGMLPFWIVGLVLYGSALVVVVVAFIRSFTDGPTHEAETSSAAEREADPGQE